MEALILDLLEWLDVRPRTYTEVMEAWRTSCPHLPVWEEASDRGYIHREKSGAAELISVSPLGRSFLARHRAARRNEPTPVSDIAC